MEGLPDVTSTMIRKMVKTVAKEELFGALRGTALNSELLLHFAETKDQQASEDASESTLGATMLC
jgi:hypothetical protein